MMPDGGDTDLGDFDWKPFNEFLEDEWTKSFKKDFDDCSNVNLTVPLKRTFYTFRDCSLKKTFTYLEHLIVHPSDKFRIGLQFQNIFTIIFNLEFAYGDDLRPVAGEAAELSYGEYPSNIWYF